MDLSQELPRPSGWLQLSQVTHPLDRQYLRNMTGQFEIEPCGEVPDHRVCATKKALTEEFVNCK